MYIQCGNYYLSIVYIHVTLAFLACFDTKWKKCLWYDCTSLNSLWTIGWTLNHKRHDLLFPRTIVHIITNIDWKQSVRQSVHISWHSTVKVLAIDHVILQSSQEYQLFFGTNKKSISQLSEFVRNTNTLHHNIIGQHTEHVTHKIMNALPICTSH